MMATTDKYMYESKVYEAIGTHLVHVNGECTEGTCINFVPHVFTLTCQLSRVPDSFAGRMVHVLRRTLDADIAKEYGDKMLELINYFTEMVQVVPTHIHFLVTVYEPDALSLKRVFKSPHEITADMLRSWVLQTFLALHALQRQGIQHNDLHFDNILIDLKPSNRTNTYLVEGDAFQIDFAQVPGRVLLYDWDLATCVQCGPNPELEDGQMCGEYGTRTHSCRRSTTLRASPEEWNLWIRCPSLWH